MRLLGHLSILGSFLACAIVSTHTFSSAWAEEKKTTLGQMADVLAPALGLQTGTLPTASVNTDQCILAVDQNFQDGFDKDELSAFCSKVSLDEIPSDPLGMKACGDTDMELPDLKDDGGKDQFCSMVGTKKDYDDEVSFKKDLCELGRDLNCKKRGHKRAQAKIECIEKRLAEMQDFVGKSLAPSLGSILNAAKKRIAEYTDMINERERQAKELGKRAAEMDQVLTAINKTLSNKFIASQGDEFYRDFQRSQEQEKTRYATETCMNAAAGLSCGGDINLSPYDFIICRSGEVATGKQKVGRLTSYQAALKESASAGVREWMEKVLKFEEPLNMQTAAQQSGVAPYKRPDIMDDVSFLRRLNSTQIVFKDVKSSTGGVAQAKVSSQKIINELQSQLSNCKSRIESDPTLKQRLADNERRASDQFVGPMSELSEAYKKLIRAATGNAAVDIRMSTCEAGDLKTKRDCVYHLASQLRSAMTGDNESGHTNPFGRVDARALGLRTLPNPHTLFNRPLTSELNFNGKNMSLQFSCRGVEQCIQQYKNYNEEFTKVVEQGRAKLQPGSSDMNTFSETMNNQVNQAGAQLGQISSAISKQWAQISSELSALGADAATLESDAGEEGASAETDKNGLPSMASLLKQAKSQGGMFKVPNPGIADARTNLTKAREKVDQKYAKAKTLLATFDAQVKACESRSKKKAREELMALCKDSNKSGKSAIDTLMDALSNAGLDPKEHYRSDAEKECEKDGFKKDGSGWDGCVSSRTNRLVSSNKKSLIDDYLNGKDPGRDSNSDDCDKLAQNAFKDYRKKYGGVSDNDSDDSDEAN